METVDAQILSGWKNPPRKTHGTFHDCQNCKHDTAEMVEGVLVDCKLGHTPDAVYSCHSEAKKNGGEWAYKEKKPYKKPKSSFNVSEVPDYTPTSKEPKMGTLRYLEKRYGIDPKHQRGVFCAFRVEDLLKGDREPVHVTGTQSAMARALGVAPPGISKHLKKPLKHRGTVKGFVIIQGS